ncbi:MAG TPA: SRPBCC family protein [Cyclobacteriaceae bacterium]
MEIYNEISINRPIEEVFKFLRNFENMPKWNYYVLKVTKITEGDIIKSSVFHQVRKNDSQRYEIIELDFPKTIAIKTLPPERNLTMRFELSSVGNITLIKDHMNIDVPWIISLFIKNKIQSAVMENLQKLKTLLETGSVVLQDGRTQTL